MSRWADERPYLGELDVPHGCKWAIGANRCLHAGQIRLSVIDHECSCTGYCVCKVFWLASKAKVMHAPWGMLVYTQLVRVHACGAQLGMHASELVCMVRFMPTWASLHKWPSGVAPSGVAEFRLCAPSLTICLLRVRWGYDHINTTTTCDTHICC